MLDGWRYVPVSEFGWFDWQAHWKLTGNLGSSFQHVLRSLDGGSLVVLVPVLASHMERAEEGESRLKSGWSADS